jgi:hypothetical protein
MASKPTGKPNGRPTKYEPKHVELGFWMAQAGLTNKQIAHEMGVTVRTLDNWKKTHPEFLRSLKHGKATPDEDVEAALLRRAKGFTYQEGDRSRVALPDTTACIFWLKNRRPEQWRDKQEIAFTKPVEIVVKYDGNKRTSNPSA